MIYDSFIKLRPEIRSLLPSAGVPNRETGQSANKTESATIKCLDGTFRVIRRKIQSSIKLLSSESHGFEI